MKMRVQFLAKCILFCTLGFCCGCQVIGISGPGRTTTLGFDLSRISPAEGQKTGSIPFHLIVAQAGAISPDSALLTELRKYPKLFRRVSVIPASPGLRHFSREVPQKDPNRLLDLARSIGGDLLFLVGGKVETTSTRTAVSVLDLSVVGKYLVPSNRIKGKASVMGAVISLSDNRLLTTLDISTERSTISSSVSRSTRTDELIEKMRAQLLGDLSKKFVKDFSDRAGVIPESSHQLTDLHAVKSEKSHATVYIISDGFHIGLILPYSNIFGEKRYVEVGLGERNWVLGKGWKWMDAMLSFTSKNEGVAVIEMIREGELKERLDEQRKVWKVSLSEEQFGRMLVSLEEDLSFQEVIIDGNRTKVIENKKGYSLFYTCHQFALNPLGVTGEGLFDSLPRPTPMIESRLDTVFERNEIDGLSDGSP